MPTQIDRNLSSQEENEDIVGYTFSLLLFTRELVLSLILYYVKANAN